MKNYWRDIIFPARKEMLAIIKTKVIENGGSLSYKDYDDCPVLNDSNEGERIFTLTEIRLDKGELFFDGSSAWDNDTWTEQSVSTDTLCDILENIDDVIELNKETEE